jgi:hypothetical protein
MEAMEPTDGTEIENEAGITSVSLPAGGTPAVDGRELLWREPLVPAGNTFWTRPPTEMRAERPEVETPGVHRSGQDDGAVVPVSEPDSGRSTFEHPGIDYQLSNVSVVPVAEVDL